MYRIELASGEETALRTVEELAAAIRSGVVTSRARIWHNSGQKWLPIAVHPHYKLALESLEQQQAAAPEKAAPGPAPLGTPQPAPDGAATPDTSAERPLAHRFSRRRAPIRLALIAGVMIIGAHLALSAMGSRDTARAEPITVPLAAAPAPVADTVAAPTREREVPAPEGPKPAGGVVKLPLPVTPVAQAAPGERFDAAPPAAPAPTPALEPAPAEVPLTMPVLAADSLGLPLPVVADSDSGKAMSRILKAISGPRPQDRSTP